LIHAGQATDWIIWHEDALWHSCVIVFQLILGFKKGIRSALSVQDRIMGEEEDRNIRVCSIQFLNRSPLSGGKEWPGILLAYANEIEAGHAYSKP